MTISKHGVAITTIDLWKEHAKPKDVDRQWRTYRSAKEAARAWLAALPALPEEITRTLATHDAFDAVEKWAAEPEAKLPFDRRGEARNSDLLVRASDGYGDFMVAVEAKADESFGESLASAQRAATKRLAKNEASKGLERIDDLCTRYLGATLATEASLAPLRYQLLTATAGALHAAIAAGAGRVVLLIQEFTSVETSHRRHLRNARALDAFVARFTRGAVTSVHVGRLVELSVPASAVDGNPPRLFVAKVTHELPLGLE